MQLSRTLTTIDAHAAGEPLRIITGGLPPSPGTTILERRRLMHERYDDIRRLLLFEPRGHADMYGAILTPPDRPDSDYGVLFLTNEGYSTMCGHGIIALTTVLLEIGSVPMNAPQTTITFDAPAGQIRATASIGAGRITGVTFQNVPSYQVAHDLEVATSFGTLTIDVAFGGAYYALADAKSASLSIVPDQAGELVRLGMEVKAAVNQQIDIRHPLEPDLSFLYGTIISSAPHQLDADGRNVTIYADGAIDRSPCGTGTSAKLANLFFNGQWPLDKPYRHESLIDTIYTGRLTTQTALGNHPAVNSEITGSAHITGYHTFVLDPTDPLPTGFVIR